MVPLRHRLLPRNVSHFFLRVERFGECGVGQTKKPNCRFLLQTAIATLVVLDKRMAVTLKQRKGLVLGNSPTNNLFNHY